MTDETVTPDANVPTIQETIEFVESYQPPIKAGTYTLTIRQEIQHKDTAKANDKYYNRKTVYVAGERFALDPSDIASRFPPPGNPGDHFNALPHIVFSRKTLPWERTVFTQGTAPTASQPDTPKATPWLSLLIFHDDDPPPLLQNVMVGDLGKEDFSPAPDKENKPRRKSQRGKGVWSYDDAYKTAGQTWELEPGQNPWDRCQIVDVPVDLFSAIAPTKEDLGWLAHAREIKRKVAPTLRAGTAAEGETPSNEVPLGDYSVIIANRLPKQGGDSTAYLVSLEGMASFLPDSDGKKSAQLGPAEFVRLVVLESWSFRCLQQKETFKGYCASLTYGPLKLRYEPPAQEGEDDKTVRDALEMGYTALNHNTRWGDRTISWYRGPLLPFDKTIEVVVPMPDAPLSTADEALRYDPELGMLDVSYAAAWQLGRLMAMRDKSFAFALLQWKQEVAHKTNRACQKVGVNEMPHIELLRSVNLLPADNLVTEAAAQPLPTEEVSARVFQFLTDTLKDTLLNLDGKENAR
jgi:hypothetical protein